MATYDGVMHSPWWTWDREGSWWTILSVKMEHVHRVAIVPTSSLWCKIDLIFELIPYFLPGRYCERFIGPNIDTTIHRCVGPVIREIWDQSQSLMAKSRSIWWGSGRALGFNMGSFAEIVTLRGQESPSFDSPTIVGKKLRIPGQFSVRNTKSEHVSNPKSNTRLISRLIMPVPVCLLSIWIMTICYR